MCYIWKDVVGTSGSDEGLSPMSVRSFKAEPKKSMPHSQRTLVIPALILANPYTPHTFSLYCKETSASLWCKTEHLDCTGGQFEGMTPRLVNEFYNNKKTTFYASIHYIYFPSSS